MEKKSAIYKSIMRQNAKRVKRQYATGSQARPKSASGNLVRSSTNPGTLRIGTAPTSTGGGRSRG